MRKKILPKLLIASMLVGGVNFVPAVVNFAAENLQIVSVAYAEFQNVTASDTAIFDFGEDDKQIINTVKNVAKMRAIQAAKEKAGIYIKSFSKTVNGVLTDDDISTYTSNNIQILDVQYKKVPVQLHDADGNDTGKIGLMYEATVTAKIDTSYISTYIQQDYQEKIYMIQQNSSSQKNVSKINQDFEDLRNTAGNKTSEQIKAEINKIDNKILAQQKLEEGMELSNQNDYQAAISKYNEAIKLNPNDAYAYTIRGLVYAKDLKNYVQALADFNKAIELNPNLAETYACRGFTYLTALKNYTKSIADFSKAVELEPNYANHYFARGMSYMGLKHYNKAIYDFNKMIELNSNYAEAYSARGFCYMALEKYNQAINDFNKAIKLNPNLAEAYKGREVCYKVIKVQNLIKIFRN